MVLELFCRADVAVSRKGVVMRLTREEIEAVRRQHLEMLELEEARRAQERAQTARTEPEPVFVDDETLQKERENELRQLKEKVEEQFYRKRGYKRYINHRGKVLWLTPEEYEFRMERKRRHRGMTGGDPQLRRRIQAVVIICVTILIAVLAGVFLAG